MLKRYSDLSNLMFILYNLKHIIHVGEVLDLKPDDFIAFTKKKRRDIIFEKLEELIESGFWKPGEQIMTEAELSQRFNVGRSTVREALNRLKNQGMICGHPGKGTFVNHPPTPDPELLSSAQSVQLTRKELLEIMDFRFCVEPVIASLASQHATQEEIEVLRDLTDLMKSDPLQSSYAYAETDLQFHIVMAECSRNPLFLAAMHTAKSYMMKQHLLTSSVSEMRPIGPRYHYQLIEALEERLPRKAEATMRAHIDETYHYVKKILI